MFVWIDYGMITKLRTVLGLTIAESVETHGRQEIWKIAVNVDQQTLVECSTKIKTGGAAARGEIAMSTKVYEVYVVVRDKDGKRVNSTMDGWQRVYDAANETAAKTKAIDTASRWNGSGYNYEAENAREV